MYSKFHNVTLWWLFSHALCHATMLCDISCFRFSGVGQTKTSQPTLANNVCPCVEEVSIYLSKTLLEQILSILAIIESNLNLIQVMAPKLTLQNRFV